MKLVSVLISTSMAAEVPVLWRQCYPCLAYKNYYCADNPNLVNLQADRCWDEIADGGKYCADFPFYQ